MASRGPGSTSSAQASLAVASGEAQICWKAPRLHPGSAARSGTRRRARSCAGCGGPWSLGSHLGFVSLGPQVWGGFCPRARQALQKPLEASVRVIPPAAGRRAQKVGARGVESPHRSAGRAGRKDPAAPSREPRRPPPEVQQACGGPHGGAPSSGGRARASAGTMTRSTLAAAPSQPAGKAISHSGRQSPAAPRFVPRGPRPLSLALITLSRLTAPRATPRTPGPRRPPHNGSGNRPRWGPRLNRGRSCGSPPPARPIQRRFGYSIFFLFVKIGGRERGQGRLCRSSPPVICLM